MSRATIIATRQSFSDWGVWPRQRANIDPVGWLANFDEEDSDIADVLLDAFVFFNTELTEQLFLSALLSVSGKLVEPPNQRRKAWKEFRNHALVTFPGQEDQNPVDSGHQFARIVRDRLGVDEGNIYTPASAARALANLHEKRPLLIVDDFIGSGAQFLECWREQVLIQGDVRTSLSEEARRLQLDHCYFVVAVATRSGIEEIKEIAPEVTVLAAHVLPGTASLSNALNPSISDEIRPRFDAFIEKYSRKSGVSIDQWGFKDLSLTIGFEHSIPDATLPLYWYVSDTWTPLRKRR